MGVAVVLGGNSGKRVNREIIDCLQVWDAAERVPVTLDQGAILTHCRIHRNPQSEVDLGADPYVVHFVCSGREYFCALPSFQARSLVVAAVPVETLA